MCGIVAYIGTQQAKPILLDGLKRLEYRGYDSAGIAVMGEERVNYQKEVGKVSVLENTLSTMSLEGVVGIAHTRWATHGKPSANNAHPHCDCTGKIWLVHNGIIENYQTLKNALIEKDHTFTSETDTEVLVHLIEHYKSNEKILLEEAVLKALSDVKGAYAIVVMNQDEPNKLVAAKFSSPLCLGVIKDGSYIIASDSSAIVTLTSEMITFDDAEMATVTFGEHRIISTKNYNILSKKTETIDWGYDVFDKGGFTHYMEKEIFEQPNTLHQTLQGRIFLEEGRAILGGIVSIEHRLREIERIHIVACGTAACAGQIGELFFEDISRISARAYLASEFRYRDIVRDLKKELIIVLSQSGETADTLKVVEDAKQKGVLTIGIVNTVGSAIAKATDAGVYCRVGPEIAVASTKAFTSQVAILSLLAIYMARQRYMNSLFGKTLLYELSRVPQYVEDVLKKAVEIEAIAKKYAHYEHFAFMGRKYQFPVALEGNIKLKEISYIHAEAFASGELKHGPIALIDNEFPSVFLCLKDSLYDKNISNIQEVKARGGKVIAIATDGDRDLCAIADDVFFIPKLSECFTPIVSVVPLQLFAYYVARERGCDIDKPRNLAKSVTVE